jgi:hypothetical protein
VRSKRTTHRRLPPQRVIAGQHQTSAAPAIKKWIRASAVE